MNNVLETTHLQVIACDKELLKTAIAGNQELSEKLQVTVPENWSEFGVEALQYALNKLTANQNEAGWWTYLVVHKTDNTLIGSGGYKGSPSEDGTVELGYEIMPEYRNKGFATEFTQALIAQAFSDPRVKVIRAHTLGQPNASTQVLLKCGFSKTIEINDPDDGLIWEWELIKPAV